MDLRVLRPPAPSDADVTFRLCFVESDVRPLVPGESSRTLSDESGVRATQRRGMAEVMSGDWQGGGHGACGDGMQ